jgi:regulatory protein
MAGRRRGARTGRGWDAAPPRAGGSGRTAAARGGRSGGNRRGRDAGPPEPPWPQWEWPDGAVPLAARPPASASRAVETPAGSPAEPPDESPARDDGERAREICLRQLAVRPRTRAELATALRKHGIADGVATEVLARYDEVGLIDDAAFARAWVSSRHHGRGLARRALASELRQRGVDSETVGEALAELDSDTEAATARALVERRLRTSGKAEPEAVFRRLVGMLARKGYPPGLAIRTVRDAMAAQSTEAAAFAEQVDPDALADAVAEADSDSRPPD